MNKTFKDFGLAFNTIKAIEKKGFVEPTLVQEKVIPLILKSRKDILVQSRTGSGKTAAFAIPLLEKLEENKPNQVLIMTPTRELAIQLSEEIYSFCGRKRFKIALLYGGQSFDSQVKRIKKGVEIIIGTPGRIHEHIERKTYKTNLIDFLILDEVDEMLKAGFSDDLEQILKYANRQRRTFFFSATIPKKIENIAKIYTKRLEKIIVNPATSLNKNTTQLIVDVLSHDKFKALQKILEYEKDFYGIIFCRTQLKAKHLGKRLSKLGFKADAVYGDLAQDIREQVIGKFRNKRITILTATDVAARGLDIPDLTHIINYSIPQTADAYIHRVGRTGRIGKTGTAITFVTPEEIDKFATFKRDLRLKLRFIDYDKLQYLEVKKEKEETTKKDVRIFIALGKKNDMTMEKLLKFVEKNTGISTSDMNNALVSDTFSFISVSQENAEIILDAFKGKRNGKRKMVDIAKDKK